MTEEIFRYFPSSLRKELEAETSFSMAEELRLRAGKRAMFYAEGEEHILRMRPDKQEIADILLALSQHSLHSFSDELRQGFFTMEGGIRIGVAGKAVSERGSIRLIRNFSSMNIRFPREKVGVQKKLAPHIRHEGNILNTLIISAPQHGKTTLLRDIVRAVSDGEDGYWAKKCTVVDERSEIAGNGAFSLGERTDVLTSCPKSEGLVMALRSLSPEVLATDEIGNSQDLLAIQEAVNSGAVVLATAHGTCLEELERRLFFRELLATGIMERIVFLSARLGRGTVERIYDGEKNVLWDEPFLL